MSRLGNLLVLQGVDSEITVRRTEIGNIEAALAGDADLDRRRSGLAEATLRRRAAEMAARAAEGEVGELRHRAQRLERRLYDGTVGNPAELLGMQGDLATLQQKIESAELVLLERMEAAEATEADLTAAAAAVTEREATRAAELQPRTERLAQARVDLADLEASRAGALAELAESDVRTYERVAARRSPAVVRLAGESCGGCHLPIGSGEVRVVRAGELVQCSNCDRILVT